MGAFNDVKLNETIAFVKKIYNDYCDRASIEANLGEISEVLYSINQTITANPSLTTYLRYHDHTVPVMFSDKLAESAYSEYFFDENKVLRRKNVFFEDSAKNIDFFFVYVGKTRAKLGFKGDSLRYIHVCRYEDERLSQIDNAHFSGSGELQTLSGELYQYSCKKLSACVKYSDYSPIFPMFMEKKKMGFASVVNPVVREFHFDYGEDGELRSYTVQPSGTKCEAFPKAVGYFNKFNSGVDIDKIVLW